MCVPDTWKTEQQALLKPMMMEQKVFTPLEQMSQQPVYE